MFLVRVNEGNVFNEPYTQEAFSEVRRCDLEHRRYRAPGGVEPIRTPTLQQDTMNFAPLLKAHISFI
jgi:hypothetical protein